MLELMQFKYLQVFVTGRYGKWLFRNRHYTKVPDEALGRFHRSYWQSWILILCLFSQCLCYHQQHINFIICTYVISSFKHIHLHAEYACLPIESSTRCTMRSSLHLSRTFDLLCSKSCPNTIPKFTYSSLIIAPKRIVLWQPLLPRRSHWREPTDPRAGWIYCQPKRPFQILTPAWMIHPDQRLQTGNILAPNH